MIMDFWWFKARNIRFHKCSDKFMAIVYTSLSNVCYGKIVAYLLKLDL